MSFGRRGDPGTDRERRAVEGPFEFKQAWVDDDTYLDIAQQAGSEGSGLRGAVMACRQNQAEYKRTNKSDDHARMVSAQGEVVRAYRDLVRLHPDLKR